MKWTQSFVGAKMALYESQFGALGDGFMALFSVFNICAKWQFSVTVAIYHQVTIFELEKAVRELSSRIISSELLQLNRHIRGEAKRFYLAPEQT